MPKCKKIQPTEMGKSNEKLIDCLRQLVRKNQLPELSEDAKRLKRDELGVEITTIRSRRDAHLHLVIRSIESNLTVILDQDDLPCFPFSRCEADVYQYNPITQTLEVAVMAAPGSKPQKSLQTVIDEIKIAHAE